MDANALANILPLILIALVFWFLIIRPARKKQQAISQLRSSLKTGDQVLLNSGIYGTITDVGESGLQVELAPGVVVRAHKDAVAMVEQPRDPLTEEPSGYEEQRKEEN